MFLPLTTPSTSRRSSCCLITVPSSSFSSVSSLSSLCSLSPSYSADLASVTQSYLIGLWFSLRTHASHIWQNAAPSANEHGIPRPISGASAPQPPTLHERRSIYQRIVPSQLFQPRRQASTIGGVGRTGQTPLQTPLLPPATPHPAPGQSASKHDSLQPLQLPHGMTADEFSRAFEAVAGLRPPQTLNRATSHVRETSGAPGAHKEEEGGHGGHDAPNWSRAKSATVLMACTVLYAIVAGASHLPPFSPRFDR